MIDGRNCRAGVVFIDLCKAFNSVDQNQLLLKLIDLYDLDPHIVRLFRNYLDNRVFKISLGDCYSTYFTEPGGIPQGSPLGNLLFTMFVNDIEIAINIPYILYADDIVIYTDGISPADIAEKLSATLEEISKWCEINKLSINHAKTEFMFFHKAHDTKIDHVPSVLLNGLPITRVYSFKYLGIILDPNLSFRSHFPKIKSQVCTAISMLQRIKRQVNFTAMKVLINAYLLSSYDYCIDIWCILPQSEMISIQSKIHNFIKSYMFPSAYKRDRKLQKSRKFIHSRVPDNTENLILKKFSFLTIKERLTWTLLKNTFQFMRSPVPCK